MVHGHVNITQEQILDQISEKDLFRFYCPNFVDVDTFFVSDLRKETKPSCRVTDFGGYLLYKDFGSSEPGTNIWGYLMRKYNCSYRDTFDIVANDFNLKHSEIVKGEINYSSSITKAEPSRRTVIKIKVRPWMLLDKNYWYERYSIDKLRLEEYTVKPISNFWINDTLFYSDQPSFSYDYYFHNGRLLRKIYQPLSKWKWYSNIDNTVVQGIANIPKYNDLLIITKSLKDIMCLRNLGYYSVAPNNEVSWLPEQVWQKFLGRYKQMFIFFDNDEAGMINAQRFSNQYGIPYFYLPIEPDVKDISDYIDKYRNVDKAKQLMKNYI